MPAVNWDHIVNLTDNTGIIQHALHNMPNRKEGYCIDDNARALLLTVFACRHEKDPVAHGLMPVYLSFIHYMQTDDGYFKNFMSYTKSCAEVYGSEDAYGRTMLALGYLINEGHNRLLVKTGREIFAKAFKHVDELVSLRGIANSIIGTCQYIKATYPDDRKEEAVVQLANKLLHGYTANQLDGWNWFDNILTYDNAILPLALLNAFEITMNKQYLDVALESMHFLESVVLKDAVLNPVGNAEWYRQGAQCSVFDQQGIDAMAMVLLYQQAFRITRNKKYVFRMQQCYQWFLGLNAVGVPLYDAATGGCCDGLQADGANSNQGAESTIAYWISHLVMVQTLKDIQE
ncbi:glycosyltransferase [Deminuibacter soli]|uniref:Glycosyltransferase n=2 Tax=Deminuibacter soli TaxID=2291815 RepID=A0A3E1NRN0_9BACT|nr:glycosyltransferase [Deminuibacter soli]